MLAKALLELIEKAIAAAACLAILQQIPHLAGRPVWEERFEDPSDFLALRGMSLTNLFIGSKKTLLAIEFGVCRLMHVLLSKHPDGAGDCHSKPKSSY
ncbi:hypothetical protein [Jannaschia faecimaris]|uniref:hypothetical protein n=1 Tax=Jannaschia faecimaris TaxID=1244108 RepID=UPI000B81FAD5|nr:hypothetical protein [Jannaschia faecimaris]